MSQQHGTKHFEFFPQCYVWPKERDLIIDAFHNQPNQPWIIKPAGSSQGRGQLYSLTHSTLSIYIVCFTGIYIATNVTQLPSNEIRGDDNWIVEKYINNPLLLHNKKFDLRLYVAITSFDPLKIYLHEEGNQ